MNVRLAVAAVFLIIVIIEIALFLMAGTPTTYERSGNTLFGGTTTVNYDAKSAQDRMYMIIIGATILIGAVVTFSIPQEKKNHV
jgi:hypothetical protein